MAEVTSTPLRVAFVGLGRVYDLNALAYRGRDDVHVVALVDPSESRRRERTLDWPAAETFPSIAALRESNLTVDAVELLTPVSEHEGTALECLAAGWHVNLQKPLANDLASARRIMNAQRASGRTVRVMENYLFYEPLRQLRQTILSGEIGEVSGFHMKMVASGRGGWEVPGDTYERQFQQSRLGRGPLLFDDGWHKLSVALWLFGPVVEVRAWLGTTELVEGVSVDAPTTVVWEHANGVRGVLEITVAVDMYLRSDYYTNDERFEVTGRRGFARVNRCTARGIQQPSLEVYRDGVTRSYHALDDDWASSFRLSGQHWIEWLASSQGPLWWDLAESVEVLRFALSAYQSDALGGVGVNPATLVI